MKFIPISSAFLGIFLISGCVTSNSGPDNSNRGIASGILSGPLGEGLDEKSRKTAIQAELAALQSGATGEGRKWNGSQQISGIIVPDQPYEVGTQTCRRYKHTINISGTEKFAVGTACKGQDGEWQPLI